MATTASIEELEAVRTDTSLSGITELELALRNAREVERANKAGGSPVASTAYDAGRVAGLQEALQIVRSQRR